MSFEDFLPIFLKIILQAFLAAKVTIFSKNSSMEGGPYRDIGLTERILDKLLQLSLPSRGLFPRRYILDQEMKNCIKDENENDQEKESSHGSLQLFEL